MSQGEPQLLVNPYEDPVVMRIRGKVSFQNSSPLKDLFEHLLAQGKRRFVIDFENCTGMDSTFLGILAGFGIQLMKEGSGGSVVLCRLSDRNLELIRNLGLHRILVVDSGDASEGLLSDTQMEQVNASGKLSEVENARMVLQAHENLVEVDASNKTKFQDVIAFLKNQMQDD